MRRAEGQTWWCGLPRETTCGVAQIQLVGGAVIGDMSGHETGLDLGRIIGESLCARQVLHCVM